MAYDFPHIRAVLASPVPELVQATWMQLLQEHARTGQSAAALSFEQLFPFGGDPYRCAVVHKAPAARVLEDGHAGFHLPSAIDWGGALARGTAKMSKRGIPYLVIPFRHFTPGTPAGGIGAARTKAAMSPDTYRNVLQAMRGDTRARERMSAAGRILSRPYNLVPFPTWLRDRARQEEGRPGYTWRAREYAGMVRREQANPRTGRKSGTYLTFRVLTQDSVGWYIPPFGGYHCAARTVARVKDAVQALVGEAARADVVELVRQKRAA